MHYLFNPIGTFGDVHPYLGLGVVLRRRGHRVTILANPYFESVVMDAGLDFEALGTVAEQEEFWSDTRMYDQTRNWRLALENCAIQPMRQAYERIADLAAPGKTVLAGPAWALGARIARDKLGIALATLHLEPYWFRSVHRSSRMPPPILLSDWVPKISKHLQYWLADALVLDRLLAPRCNAFRAELGLTPVRRLMHRWWHSPDQVVALFPEWFFPKQPDWPQQTVQTGFPIWDRSDTEHVPSDVRQFLDAGSAPVIFAPGSENRHAEEFFRTSVECCRRMGYRGMLMTGHAKQVPGNLPFGVVRCGYVPFRWLFPRSQAVVHCALTGTAALAMAAGIPQVVMPLAYDQPDTAECLRRLGVATVLCRRNFTPSRLCTALARLAEEDAVHTRCREIARHFDTTNPLEQTANVLEALAGRSATS